MATYDLLMLAILVGLTLYGYFKGMAWQIAYVASFVASYFVAVRFADQVAPNITFVNPPANKFVAMLLIYAGCSFAVWTIFRVIRNGIDSVKMEGFDHQMGAIIGFARGVLWCVGVTFFAVTLLPATQKQQIVNSRSGYYIARLLDETNSLFPPEVHQVVGPYLDRLNSELHNGQAAAPSAAPQSNPFGWPTAGATTPQPAPAWGQPAQPTGWPAATQPATNQPAANRPPSASDYGWPAASNPPPQATTPAQSASWPQWEQ
ncbi:Colicin V production protein [Botrimarina colliarenosi]|uniref:Colicin V production protein n=1 Tax=Botrimarina colliarenosi TaxID=2528001 RepID=A0A5C6ADA8_9BACT|nr:CvpA family protein [Botrimarina colliarenosi]TWT97944.1 Colicin V production protein [Botrimarina colliarenosi]